MEVTQGRVNPKLFIVWLLILASFMLFAGLTSGFIVRKAEGNWFDFRLPVWFLISTITIVASSATMIWAMRSARRDEIKQVQYGLGLTLLLGLLFGVFQFLGWQDMVREGLFFSDPKDGTKVSASFVYAMSGLHLIHIVGGLLFLVVVLYKAFNSQVHKKKLLSIKMCNTYWHFLGILWVYLYLFLYFARQI
jgi:cytochrome c oxidase subunit 3